MMAFFDNAFCFNYSGLVFFMANESIAIPKVLDIVTGICGISDKRERSSILCLVFFLFKLNYLYLVMFKHILYFVFS